MMDPYERIAQLERDLMTMSTALRITCERTNWLMLEAAKTASPESLDDLERRELTCITDTAMTGQTQDAALARRVLDILNLTAPDFIPAEMES